MYECVCVCATLGMLEREIYPGSRMTRIRKVALNEGSSKQGKAFLADRGSNWVAARTPGREQRGREGVREFSKRFWSCVPIS